MKTLNICGVLYVELTNKKVDLGLFSDHRLEVVEGIFN